MCGIVKKIIRLGIGSVFIIAAILKLLSLDQFEIYIYSFNIFDFITTTLISRLIISGEMILGTFLVFNIYRKFTWLSALIAYLLFTVFLIFVAIFRDDANCHCFGDLIELNPLESIAKNLLIVVLLIFIKNEEGRKHKAIIPVTLCVLSFVLTFVVTPMDAVYNKIFSSEKEISSNDLRDSFDEMMKIDFTDDGILLDSVASFVTNGERQMLVFVSSGCKYCQLGVKKLSLVVKNNNLNAANVNIVIWGSDEGIVSFKEVTDTHNYSYWHIMPRRAIDITYGRFPTFVLMKDDDIIDIGDFRDIDDDIEL